MADETNRTSDGFLTLDALREGLTDQQVWDEDATRHMVILSCIRSEPVLIKVEHTIIRDMSNYPPGDEVHAELFDDVRQARNEFRRLRNDPPETYGEA